MRTIQVSIFAFVLSCAVGAMSAQGVLIEPSNIWPKWTPPCTVEPQPLDYLFSFDFIVSDPEGVSAQGFQAIISVSGPGVLTGHEASSVAVATDTNYWIFGNSAGAEFIDNGDSSYTFGDNPNNGVAEPLEAGNIMARYEFKWDGTVGDYTFTIDLDTSRSFYLDEFFSKQAFQFSPGQYQYCGNDSSFTLHIVPEPGTMILIGLGSLALLKKRRA